ncbi:BREX protein BrxB domain-containing protein [Namhaeicola litoreus]|uniref:BREX protein BrxB domain-containing protein n=1 Tax=Namhaeicola litoreus TaxID=1052145 RepID=A0ABW3Y083_9FLAO
MTITELYARLSDKDFQDHETGNLFFPAYMYTYDATKEYEIDAQILNIKNRLHRPNNYLDVMVIDIFEEFVNHLKNRKFGKATMFDYLCQHEKNNPDQVDNSLKREGYKDEFLNNLDETIKAHLAQAKDYEVAYVFMKGFGRAYPYIRASRFMSKFEKHVKGYKLVLFYPGEAKDYYSLFGILKDENLYRAIKLINE